ncbi:hypothetical protein KIN20_022353 [Parelaphostrongylus tenuis]|uniref:Uncharacterized protein n=1 Tax=Parelaphostrongylus tenuis TaxID=148309 RepID=A0AAD5MQ23_PARTN|nr:hypothetical protein KIN20_022353 [Parelaphostrongylus tenuis]
MVWYNCVIPFDQAQIEPRHPSAKHGNKNLHFTRPQDVLDESYEDLLSIEKPCSLFEKLSSTSSTKLTPEHEVTEGLQKLEKYVEEVNSPEWMKEKCLYFSKEVWNTTKSRGFMRTMVDELTPVPGLEEDMVTLDENERVVVESKNTLIWSTVVELAAMLWPEISAKQTSISSKWLPIPKSFEEFAKMAERYVIEQFSDLPSSHRYTRLSRPWTSESPETPVENIVAQCLYGKDPNCVSFNRKVNAERRRLCEELIELVGDRFVLSEIQKATREDENEITGTSSSSTFDRLCGEDGRPSLGCLSTNNARSVERR